MSCNPIIHSSEVALGTFPHKINTTMVNQLYPAFFRLDRLQLLVVGAGKVGEEKLKFILKSSPNARVTIVAPWMGEELKSLLDNYHQAAMQGGGARVQGEGLKAAADGYWRTSAGGWVSWLQRKFRPSDVLEANLVVAATNFPEVNRGVYSAAKANHRLCNIADTPELCDFYLGSIVTRGPLKVAISTNGQSPTFAKRFRQFLEAELPQFETTNLLDNLKVFRDRLTGNFAAKVRQLNAVTSNLLSAANDDNKPCGCPAGECLVAAASTASPSPAAPASAPQKDTES